jgi:ABC-2 type transport system permease protein
MWVFKDTGVLEYGYADMSSLFLVGPYVFMFLIPAITMRSFSEERKTGTIEFLFTKPLSEYEIVLGKFLASWLLAIFSVLPTIIYYISLYYLGTPKGNIDSAGVIGSYIGLILLASIFTALGILGSALTESQVVAFVISLALCYVFYDGFDRLASLNIWSVYSIYFERMGISFHYNALSRGLIDSRNVIYFFSVTAMVVISTVEILKNRIKK